MMTGLQNERRSIVNTARRRGNRAPQDSETARQLVRAATEVMIERDTLDISYVDIGAKADLPPGLIGYYFGNKEGLLYAILETAVKDGLEQLDALIASDLSATEKLRLHLHGVVTAYHRAPYFNRLLKAMTRDSSPDRVTLIADRMIRPMTEAQGRIIDEGIATGEFRPIDKMRFYFSVVGAADSLHSSRFILNSVFGIDEIDQSLHHQNKADLVEMFMRFIVKPD
jgi:AcrR family transcriptional regulator